VRPAIWLALALVAGCSRGEKTVEQRGVGVFLRTCSGCHGVDGRGSSRPGFQVPPRDLTDPSLLALRDEDIAHVVREGRGQMPPFGRLMPPEDVDAVVRFVRTLHGGGATGAPAQSASTTSAP
jgi:mono/diheme cytochrome c family protein